MQQEYVAQAIGIAAFIINFYALIQSDDDKFFNYSILSWVLFTLHFGILSELNLMIVTSIILCRMVVAKEKFRDLNLMVGFLSLSLIQICLMVTEYIDFIPIAATMIGTVSYFFFRGLRMRYLAMLSSGMLLYTSIAIGSYGFAMNEVMTIILLTIAILKIHRDRSKHNLKAAKPR